MPQHFGSGHRRRSATSRHAKTLRKVLPIARKIDFPGREARNRELGQAGEELVFEHERRLLTDAGHPELAKRVRWVSEEEGDGAGYDIASFSRAGGSRLIEVKTTNGWDRTPFYISPNELEVAEQRRDEWRLLRVWNFSRRTQGLRTASSARGPCDLGTDKLSGELSLRIDGPDSREESRQKTD